MSEGEENTDRARSLDPGRNNRGSNRPILNKTSKPFLMLLFGAILFLGSNVAVFAANFTVTKTADTNDGACDADCSLREAIAAANGSTGNDVVLFSTAVFQTERTIVLSGTPLTITNNGSLWISGTGSALLTISGNNSSGVIIIGPLAVVTINSLTVADGNTAGNGGGILNNGGDLTLDSSTLRNCAAGLGGGIFSNSTLTITNSTITNNTAAGVGGGIYNFFSGTLTVTNSTISGNRVTDGIGGGIANGGFASLTNVTLSANSVGVIANPDGGMGGGVFSGGVLNATNSTIKDNSAVRGGGFGTRGGSLAVAASTITNNQAGIGSGICNGCSINDSGGATAELTNITINGNSAYDTGGGGIYNTQNNSIVLDYCTISSNAAPTAGGILNLNSGSVTAHGSIIADNSATSGSAPDFQGILMSQGYNLIENTGGTTIIGSTTGNIIGVDPRLGPLANNGGPTSTCSLLPDSPAMDSADPASFPPTDQRGVTRPQNPRGMGAPRSDIGGFESAKRRVLADFDGDGRTDLSVFRPSDGNWYLNRSSLGFTGVNWGLSTDTVVPGDFDADGMTDFAVFRPVSDGGLPDFYVLRSSDFTIMYASWGVPGDTPVIGDYDGDLRSDFAVYRQSNNLWYISRSSDGGVQIHRNLSGGRPATGDFDGDGRTDICNYPGSEWFILRSSTNYTLMVLLTIGGAQDRTAAADYDGDGMTDAAIYNPTNGTWVIRYSSTATTANIRWGISTDIAVPGDYDGDGLGDIAIYRDGTWWLRQSRDGIAARQFGLNGDVPVPNRYLP